MSFTLEVGPLSDEAKILAETELRETPENVKKGIEELREYLKNDPTLTYDTDDEFLVIFLRPCKYYAKSAYELVCNFFFYLRYSVINFNFFFGGYFDTL